MGNPLSVSIVTICLNHLDGLKRTHASLKAQNSQNYQWIVVDGGSSDATPAYLKQTDADWTSEADSGLYEAMNKGLERAGGDYVWFLNAGDALAGPEVLGQVIDKTKKSQPSFIYGDSLETLHGEAFHRPARPHRRGLTGMFASHQAMIYNRAAIGGLKFDQRYPISADYDFTCRFLKGMDQKRIAYIPEALCRFEGGGLSQRHPELGRGEQFAIRRNLNLCGLVTNAAIYAGQSLTWQMRQYAPALYRQLRSFYKTENANAQNQTLAPHP